MAKSFGPPQALGWPKHKISDQWLKVKTEEIREHLATWLHDFVLGGTHALRHNPFFKVWKVEEVSHEMLFLALPSHKLGSRFRVLRDRLNSIKKDDSYQNGNWLVLTKAKLLLHEDDLRTRLTVHHHWRKSHTQKDGYFIKKATG